MKVVKKIKNEFYKTTKILEEKFDNWLKEDLTFKNIYSENKEIKQKLPSNNNIEKQENNVTTYHIILFYIFFFIMTIIIAFVMIHFLRKRKK